MEKSKRTEEFLDITMRIVAESGLSNFSMKKVTERIGVSEALLYKYFPTKEILLYSCFENVHKRIAALYNRIQIRDIDADGVYGFCRDLWTTYFTFLVDNGYRTIFYFDYRDSPYIRNTVEHDYEAKQTYFKDFAAILHVLDARFRLKQKIDSPFLWTYILDTSGIFAKRVIRGELPRGADSYGQIWQLLSGGILGLIQD